jgi:hypothetical protein
MFGDISMLFSDVICFLAKHANVPKDGHCAGSGSSPRKRGDTDWLRALLTERLGATDPARLVGREVRELCETDPDLLIAGDRLLRKGVFQKVGFSCF